MIVNCFDRRRRECLSWCLIVAILAGMGIGAYYRNHVESRFVTEVQQQNQERAIDLGDWNVDGFAIGALSMLGRHNTALKAVIDQPVAQARQVAAMPLKTLAMVVGADHAFVANREGVIVAAYDSLERSVVGLDVGFRPYFRTALQGGRSVYGAISSTTGQRMFYMAAPVYESQNKHDRIIGVLVARFDARTLEAGFNKPRSNDLVLVMSPNGIVLASNAPQFVLKADHPWTPAMFSGDIRRQFSDHSFSGGVPEPLPFELGRPVVEVEGQRYAVARNSFDWSDPGGPWSVVTLSNLNQVLTDGQVLLVSGASALFLMLLMWAGLRRLSDARQHQRDVQRIEQSERRLDLALQSGALGLWDWHVSLGIIVNNDVWLRILGYCKGELDQTLGNGLERWAGLVHPDDRAQVLAKLYAHIDNQTDEYRAEYRMLSKSGQWLWVLDIGRVMERDIHGAATRVTGVLQDISAMVDVQQTVVESQTKLSSMIGNIPGAVFRSLPDRERTMLFVSDAIEAICGVSAQAFIAGKPLRDLVHPDDLAVFDRSLENPDYVLEYRIIATDGAIRWLYDKGQIIRQDGLPQYLDGVIFDISERKASEALLQHSRQQAELAIQAKSAFLDTMSHEIRTPLNAVIGMAHLVLDMPLESRQRRYIEKMDRAAKHLVTLVNGMLDLSGIESGKLKLEQVTFNLVDLLDEVMGLVSSRLQQKTIELRTEIPQALRGAFIGDPHRLQQVFINLMDNAIKFTESGSVTIDANLLKQWQDDIELEFIVRDTGVGMTPQQCARLFDAFVQADASISRRYGGTGLGLAICKRIVQMMGGTIEVQSIEGQGSSFRFNVCLRIAQAPLSEPVGEDSQEERALSLLGARVLVVEDNTLNQEVFMDLLQRAGVRVVIAGNGQDALAILARDTAFDAVLMDCQMPILDGYQATARIRQELHLHCLPVIAVTANLPGEVQARVLSAGMNDCIVKPLEVRMFYRTLCRWIGRGTRPADESAVPPYAPGGAGGIDLAHGLAVAGHDPALHQRLLRMFLRDNQVLLAQLWSAHESNDRPSLAALAHGLRGSAGHIGAMTVQAAAARLEQGAASDEDTLAPMLALSTCLQSLLATLASIPSLDPCILPLGKDAGSGISPAEVERLAGLLLQNNAQALEVVEALCQRDAGGRLLEVREAIYRMDFTYAHRLLSATQR
ncbi:PAS domain-containing protein [Pseudomonas sp. CCOS 191]|uniref:PAS domain-containing protein n=1 Tax=Pseudomonas sp. CCOS 191 TaxID=1649877 RepID=UPI001E3E2550|nr:PAS domain-containing protein [Pseudomonas sp. CCOS 191]